MPKSEVCDIGHGTIIRDELKVLRERGLEWVLDPQETQRLMSLPVPGQKPSDITATIEEALKRLRREHGVGDEDEDEDVGGEVANGGANMMKLHPRFRRMQKVYAEQEGLDVEVLLEYVELLP